jgi:hypothetical protein
MSSRQSPELIALAARLYEELKSGNKVAQRLDIAPTTLYRMLRESGVDLPGRFSAEVQGRKKKLHGQLARNAANDYASGMPVAALCKKYGCKIWAIRTAARDLGVTLRSQGGRYRDFSQSDKTQAATLYKEGWSQAQIAAKFRSSQITIGRMLRDAGVKTRRRSATGSSHGSWKGGRVKLGGYIGAWLSPADPLFVMADQQSYVMEHRLVMARHLGRPLLASETVHHINGDTTDNRVSNLQLRAGRHGKGVVMKCAKCGSHKFEYHKI